MHFACISVDADLLHSYFTINKTAKLSIKTKAVHLNNWWVGGRVVREYCFSDMWLKRLLDGLFSQRKVSEHDISVTRSQPGMLWQTAERFR